MSETKNIDNEILVYQITVKQTNELLTLLGDSPYAKAYPHVALLHEQGRKQIQQLLGEQNEHKE
jgi:hypothetical protein